MESFASLVGTMSKKNTYNNNSEWHNKPHTCSSLVSSLPVFDLNQLLYSFDYSYMNLIQEKEKADNIMYNILCREIQSSKMSGHTYNNDKVNWVYNTTGFCLL